METILYNLLWFALLFFTFLLAKGGFFGSLGLKAALDGKVKVGDSAKHIVAIGLSAAVLVWMIRDYLKGPDASLVISKIGFWITEVISGKMNPWTSDQASEMIRILDNMTFVVMLIFLLILAWYGFLGNRGIRGALSGQVSSWDPIGLIVSAALAAALLIWFITDFQKGPEASLWISKVGEMTTEILTTKMNRWQP